MCMSQYDPWRKKEPGYPTAEFSNSSDFSQKYINMPQPSTAMRVCLYPFVCSRRRALVKATGCVTVRPSLKRAMPNRDLYRACLFLSCGRLTVITETVCLCGSDDTDRRRSVDIDLCRILSAGVLTIIYAGGLTLTCREVSATTQTCCCLLVSAGNLCKYNSRRILFSGVVDFQRLS